LFIPSPASPLLRLLSPTHPIAVQGPLRGREPSPPSLPSPCCPSPRNFSNIVAGHCPRGHRTNSGHRTISITSEVSEYRCHRVHARAGERGPSSRTSGGMAPAAVTTTVFLSASSHPKVHRSPSAPACACQADGRCQACAPASSSHGREGVGASCAAWLRAREWRGHAWRWRAVSLRVHRGMHGGCMASSVCACRPSQPPVNPLHGMARPGHSMLLASQAGARAHGSGATCMTAVAMRCELMQRARAAHACGACRR
jgi:hypothetical protein